jgi:hypothetical protein
VEVAQEPTESVGQKEGKKKASESNYISEAFQRGLSAGACQSGLTYCKLLAKLL